jgi:phosphate:Na+ symporter
LHMGDIVEDMLRKSMVALMTNDRKLAAEVSHMDNAVDRLDEAIKLYVTKVTRESLNGRDGRRAMEIIAFSINLEHVGDIVDKNLMELAVKKIKHKYQFSKEGAAELEAFHKRILDNLKLAFSVFIDGNATIARMLIEQKAAIRQAELACAEQHLARLREGRAESIETSSLHLDILRDLKRIHSHICSVATRYSKRRVNCSPAGSGRTSSPRCSGRPIAPRLAFHNVLCMSVDDLHRVDVS